MFIYNVTVKVDWSIHHEWLQWMKKIFIPGMLDTDYFFDARVFRLLQVDETDGATYAIQYITESLDLYNRFVDTQLEVQHRKEVNKWGNNFVSFSTILELVY